LDFLFLEITMKTNQKLILVSSVAIFVGAFVLFASRTASAITPDGVQDKKGTSCGDPNMVKVGPICVDVYEASVWSMPPSNGTPQGTQFGATGDVTAINDNYPCSDNGNDCSASATNPIFAASLPGVKPSAFITWFQAQQACANVGKRLLRNGEWQMAAAGTPDDSASCNIGTGNISTDRAENTNARETTCVSNFKVVNMVGNVWEWVEDWIQGNTSPFAPSSSGMPGDPPAGTAGTDYGDDLMAGTNPATSQGDSSDLPPALNSQNFPAALLRGGNFFRSMGGGVFALRADHAPATPRGSTGFRCAR
jgi:formylglycine-generating enzyme required for sulfatase activity